MSVKNPKLSQVTNKDNVYYLPCLKSHSFDLSHVGIPNAITSSMKGTNTVIRVKKLTVQEYNDLIILGYTIIFD